MFGLLWPQYGLSSNDSQMCTLRIWSLGSWVCGMAEQPCFGFSLCTVEDLGRVQVGSPSLFILLWPGATQTRCEKSQDAALWASSYRHFYSRCIDVTKSNPTSLSGKASCIHTGEQYLSHIAQAICIFSNKGNRRRISNSISYLPFSFFFSFF